MMVTMSGGYAPVVVVVVLLPPAYKAFFGTAVGMLIAPPTAVPLTVLMSWVTTALVPYGPLYPIRAPAMGTARADEAIERRERAVNLFIVI